MTTSRDEAPVPARRIPGRCALCGAPCLGTYCPAHDWAYSRELRRAHMTVIRAAEIVRAARNFNEWRP